MNLKFTFFYSISPNQRNKIKNKLLPLARNIYILSYDRDSSSFSTSSFDLPLISFSFFFFSFTFFISPSNFFFPLSCNHFSFSARTKISPLPLTNSNCARGKHREICFQAFLHIFGQFYNISYAREVGWKK